MGTDEGGQHEPGGRGVVRDGGLSRLDRIFGALAHARRRAVLYHLRGEGEADVETLAGVVGAWEEGTEPDELDGEVRERVQADLRHVHLPKLEDYKLVEYDQRSGEVSYRHPPEPLDGVVELATEYEEPP